MSQQHITSFDQPFATKKFLDIHGHRMAYIDEGEGQVAILRPDDYDDWLGSTNPEFARTLVQLYPADRLEARPAYKSSAKKDSTKEAEPIMTLPIQPSLF